MTSVVASTTAAIERLTADIDDPQARRKARLLLHFTLVIAAMGALMTVVNVRNGKPAAGAAIGVGALLVCVLVPYLVRRARLAAAGHVILAIGALVWVRVASDKGGLLSTVLAWQASTLVLGTLIVGARQTIPWLAFAVLNLAYWAGRFDPSVGWTGAQGTPAVFALSVAVAWSVTVGFAYLFEREVERATALVKKKNEEMRHVLDEIAQGLSIMGLDGSIGAARSAQLERWLGPPAEDETFASWLSRVDPRAGQLLALGLEMLREDVLPTAMALELLPRELRRGEQVLTLAYSGVERHSRLIGVLVVVTDVTELRAAARAEEEQRAVLTLVGRLHSDPDGARGFVGEARRIVSVLEQDGPPLDVLRREIHTLKGSAALLGLDGVQARCHALESWSAENDGELPLDRRRDLVALWRAIDARVAPLLGDGDPAKIVLEPHEHAALVEAAERGAPAAVLARQLRALRGQPLSSWLARVAQQAEALAKKLGKPHVVVELDAGEGRVDTERLGPVLSSVVHAVRNALDHGVEPEAERLAQGKPSAAHLRLTGVVDETGLRLEIADDGRGVPWSRVAAKAEARGLPCHTPTELQEALFADGLSTAAEVSEISGRGVGLSALRAAARAAGGEVSLESEPGRGTRLVVRVPTGPRPRLSVAA